MRQERLDRERHTALLAAARAAAAGARAKHSGFRVGAAVLDEAGRVHPGCNVESDSYGLTICAERVAIFAALAAGARRMVGLAVSCVDAFAEAWTVWAHSIRATCCRRRFDCPGAESVYSADLGTGAEPHGATSGGVGCGAG